MTHLDTDPSDEPSDLIPGPITDAEHQRRRDAELAAGPPACSSCGKPTTFDPSLVGMTCGGLWLRGWYTCPDHHGTHGRGLADVCEAPTWTVSKGGRSVDIGTGRIRFGALKVESGERLDVVGLMTRIAKLPELERELEARRTEAKSELARARAHVIEAARALDTGAGPMAITTVITLDRALQRLARAEGRSDSK